MASAQSQTLTWTTSQSVRRQQVLANNKHSNNHNISKLRTPIMSNNKSNNNNNKSKPANNNDISLHPKQPQTQLQREAAYNNKAQAFLSRGAQVIVRMRGLPFTCTAQQVIDFFQSNNSNHSNQPNQRCEVLAGLDGVLFVKNQDEKPNGDAFVLFASEEHAQRALQKHRKNIGSRYVELFRSTISEVQQVLSISMSQSQLDNNNSARFNSANQAKSQSRQPTSTSAWASQVRHSTSAVAGVTYAQVATSRHLAHSQPPVEASESQPASEGQQQLECQTTPPINKTTNTATDEPKAVSDNQSGQQQQEETKIVMSESKHSGSDSSAFDNNSVESASATDTQLVVGGELSPNNEQLLSSYSSAHSPISSMSAASTGSSSYKSSHYDGQRHQNGFSSSQQHNQNVQRNNTNNNNQSASNVRQQSHQYNHYGLPVACHNQDQQQQHLHYSPTGMIQRAAAPNYYHHSMGSPMPLMIDYHQQQAHSYPTHYGKHQMAAYHSNPYHFYPAHHQQFHGQQQQQHQQEASKRDCIRLRGLPFEAQVEDVLLFLSNQSKNITYQGVHMVYSAQGQPTGEAIIQMNSSSSASQAAQEFHKKVMKVGKKQRYIEVIPCSIDDMNLMVGLNMQPSAPTMMAAPPMHHLMAPHHHHHYHQQMPATGYPLAPFWVPCAPPQMATNQQPHQQHHQVDKKSANGLNTVTHSEQLSTYVA